MDDISGTIHDVRKLNPISIKNPVVTESGFKGISFDRTTPFVRVNVSRTRDNDHGDIILFSPIQFSAISLLSNYYNVMT